MGIINLEKKMKLPLIKRTFTTVMIVSVLRSNYALASLNEPVDANRPHDPNAHNFVWVVALEKGSRDEVCSEWNPTLFKISVRQSRVVEKKKIAEQGAPLFCYSLPGERIRVILCEGIASNGTYVAEKSTTFLTIDKKRIHILESKNKQGRDDPQEYRKIILSDKNKRLNIYKPKAFEQKKGNVFLGTSKIRPRSFMLKGFLKDKQALSLEILDPNTLKAIESIPLAVGNRKLGGFFGADLGNATLIADRYVICLFGGNSSIGTFAPGYVTIVDTELKTVKYVAIGSNAACGIAY